MFFNTLSVFIDQEGNPEEDYLPSIEYEEKIMGIVDLRKDIDYKIYDVELPKSKGHIHTIEAGFQNEETIVLIHGYAASAVFYFKVIALLKDHFHIYSIDLFGLGTSHRPKFEVYDYDQTVSFFIEPLEEWREALKLDNFILMGHSMGGYLSAQYLLRKKPNLKMLYLLSPAGFTNKSDEEMEKEPRLQGFRINLMRWLFGMVHHKGVTPFSFTIFGQRRSINRYFSGGRLKLTEAQSGLFADYYSSTLLQKISGEKALGALLRFGRYSNYPIANGLSEIDKADHLNTPVKVMYGEKDWMDFAHSKEINKKLDLNLEIVTIPDCDHQIIYQNPDGIVEILLADKKKGFDVITTQFNIHRKNGPV